MPGSNSIQSEPVTFLGSDPPHWAARGLAWLLPLIFAVAALAAIFVQTPEVVNAPFSLIPVRGTDPVRALRAGIVTEVTVKEGQTVEQGERLFVIRSEAVIDRSAELLSLDTQRKGADASLSNIQEKFSSQQQGKQEEERKLTLRHESLKRLIEHKNKELTVAKQMAESYAKLQQDGLASVTDRTDRQLEVTRIEAQLEQLQSEQHEILTTIEKLRFDNQVEQSEHNESARRLREEGARLQIRQTALQQSLVQGQGGQFTAHAPCRGVILSLKIKNAGAQVGDGETLCELACAGEKLQAELQLPQAGIGRIKQGQSVKLMYDAFPYQRYGIKYASLRWLSPTSTSATFRALADVSDEQVLVAGQPRAVMAGMGGQAQVIIGKRSLISFLWEPLQQLKENMAMPTPAVTPATSPPAATKGGTHEQR